MEQRLAAALGGLEIPRRRRGAKRSDQGVIFTNASHVAVRVMRTDVVIARAV